MPKRARQGKENQQTSKLAKEEKSVPKTVDGFYFESCEPEVGMGRLYVECNCLHIFLAALFENDEAGEGEANMKEEDENPLEPIGEGNGDSEATVESWKARLVNTATKQECRYGRWTVHMPLLQKSRVFYDRVEAQIWIYETFKSKLPTVSLFDSSFLYVGDGTLGKETQKACDEDDTLRVANTQGNAPEEKAVCVYFDDVQLDDVDVPIGCGPLETHPDVAAMQMPKGWRKTFADAWKTVEEKVTDKGKNNGFARDFLSDMSLEYTTFYMSELHKIAKKDPLFREALCATYPVRLIYFPKDPGCARHALLWEKVRCELLPAENIETKPVMMEQLELVGEEDPSDFIYDLKQEDEFRSFVRFLDTDQGVGLGLTETDLQVLPPIWKDVLTDQIKREYPTRVHPDCNLCPYHIRSRSPKIENATKMDFITAGTQHALKTHGLFGALQVMLLRGQWCTSFVEGYGYDYDNKNKDSNYQMQGVVKSKIKDNDWQVLRLNIQGQFEKIF